MADQRTLSCRSEDFQQFVTRKPRLAILTDHALDRRQASAVFDLDPFNFRYKLGPVYDILRYGDTDEKSDNCCTPMAILISGGWGTGKTSAMRWLDALLHEWNDTESGTAVHSVWFDPWKYDSKEDVWRGLISEIIIASALTQKQPCRKAAKAAKRFGLFLGKTFLYALASMKFKGSLPGVDAEIDLNTIKETLAEYKNIAHPEKAYLNDFEDALRDWLTQTLQKNERMVVFIDDLDRCMPDIALEVLEALKLYLSIPSLVFVVGVDKTVIERLIVEHYRKLGLVKHSEPNDPEEIRKQCLADENKAKQYLSKMFQVEVELAPTQQQVRDFLDYQLSSVPYWKERLSTEHHALFSNIVLKLAERNPREVKRFLNSGLMVGVGSEMGKANGETNPFHFAQGLQDFFIRSILHKSYPSLAWLIDTDVGRDFFTEWSTLERPGTAGGTVSRDEVQGKLNARTQYKDYVRLVSDADLCELMKIPFSTELARFTCQVAEPAQSPGVGREAPAGEIEKGSHDLLKGQTIIQEAIAHEINKRPSELTPADYNQITRLDLSYSGVEDLVAIESLEKLEFLALAGCGQLSSIRPLQKLTSLEELDLREARIDSFEPLQSLTRLRRLHLRGTSVDDFTPLQGLTNLQSLALVAVNIKDLNPLKGLTGLLHLDLQETQVSEIDLPALEALTNLQSLCLCGTPISRLDPLASLTSLRRLDVHNTSVAELSPLGSLTALRELDLCRTNVKELSPLRALNELATLYLEVVPVSNLTPLESLTSLRWLRLAETDITELKPLRQLTNLEQLRLATTHVTDLTPLEDMRELKQLWIEGTQVANLSPLTRLGKLKEFHLADTPVTDFAPLGELIGLEYLDLRNTQVTDLASLRTLADLQELDLRNTRVTDLDPLHGLSKLQRLYLGQTPVSKEEILDLQRTLPRLHVLT